MEISSVIAVIAVLGLIATIGVLVYMLMRAQAFIMMSTSPHAAVEVLKTVAEKNFDKAERKKAAEVARRHARFRAAMQNVDISPGDIKEFGVQE